MTPPEPVLSDKCEERHKWLDKWAENIEEGFKDIRNDVIGLKTLVSALDKKIDQLLRLERTEAKGKADQRKALLALAGKLIGSGGAGAAILYVAQRILGG